MTFVRNFAMISTIISPHIDTDFDHSFDIPCRFNSICPSSCLLLHIVHTVHTDTAQLRQTFDLSFVPAAALSSLHTVHTDTVQRPPSLFPYIAHTVHRNVSSVVLWPSLYTNICPTITPEPSPIIPPTISGLCSDNFTASLPSPFLRP